MIELGDASVFQIESGGTPKSTEDSYWGGGIHWATLVDLPQSNYITQISRTERTISEAGLKDSAAKILPPGTVIVSSRATIGRVGIARVPLATNQGFKNIVIRDDTKALPEFVAYMMKRLAPQMESMATGGTFKEISKSTIATLKIPLPPLAIQQEIVAVIEGYQKIIDGARQVVENYQPRIDVHTIRQRAFDEVWLRLGARLKCSYQKILANLTLHKLVADNVRNIILSHQHVFGVLIKFIKPHHFPIRG